MDILKSEQLLICITSKFWYKNAIVLVNINLMRCLPWEVFVIPNKQNNNVPTIFCLVLINDTCVWYHFRMTLTFLPSGIKSKYADSKLNRLIRLSLFNQNSVVNPLSNKLKVIKSCQMIDTFFYQHVPLKQTCYKSL